MSHEVWSGVSAFIVSACIIFINIAIIGRQTFSVGLSEGTGYYTGLYFVTMLCSFIGTMLIGLLCNLPLVQSAGLSLSGAFIAMAGGDGLTFENVLAVTLVSSILFTVVTVTPLRKWIYSALPQGVKKALPIGVGVFIVVMFLNLTAGGDVTVSGSMKNILSTDIYATPNIGIVCVTGIVAAFVCGLVLKALGKKGVFRLSLLVGVIVYYVLGCILCFSDIIGQNRAFLIVDASGLSYNIVTAIENAVTYNFFAVFAKGFDFSAYTAAGGNVVLLFLQGILTFLMLGCYDSVGNAQASLAHGGVTADDKQFGKALLITGGVNVLASVLGAAPIDISSSSAASADDGGKTGLTSVVCGIGLFVSLFLWIVFALLASTLGASQDYGHNEFSVYIKATFEIVYAAMALVGFSMILKGAGNIAFQSKIEAFVVVVSVLAVGLSANLTVGIGVGVLADIIAKFLNKKRKKIALAELIVGLLLLLYIVFGV